MKPLTRVGKMAVGAVLIVAGAVVGLNPKWELRKLRRGKQGGPADEDSKALY